MCHFILENSQISCHHNKNSCYYKNKLCHFILKKVKSYIITNNIIYKYMTWFKRISVKEYENLIRNKNKMYNITPQFTSPEILNKYRDEDDNINKKIEIDEKLNIQNENVFKEIDKNLNKYLEKKTRYIKI